MSSRDFRRPHPQPDPRPGFLEELGRAPDDDVERRIRETLAGAAPWEALAARAQAREARRSRRRG